jgi:hypothetical protein
MRSLATARRWGAPLAAVALALAVVPAAQAAPPNVHTTVGSYASQNPIDVGFVTDEPVTIYYTTNGSAPTTGSSTYSGTPLHFTQTTTLRWLAVASDDGNTSSGTEYYTVDRNPPTISIQAPTQGGSFTQYSTANALYSCADAEIAYTQCTGTVPSGSAIDTATAGQKTFTVVAYDAAGNRSERSVTYTVNPATQTGGGVSGSVPATLTLALGSAPSFGAFQAGVARDYFSSTIATVTSSAGDATMSVADPSSFATGHLVNGTFVMPQALQVGTGSTYAPVGGSSAPTTVKTYSGPITGDAVTVNFKQSVAANDALRSGAYNKTLTFTLSTTQP